MNPPFDHPQSRLPLGSGAIMFLAIAGAIGLGIGVVAAILAYVPASPWEALAALVPFLAAVGLTWVGGRRFASLRPLRLNHYSGFLRLLGGACAVLALVLISSGLVYAAAFALIGDEQWAGLISILPAAGPIAIFFHYRDVQMRNMKQELVEISAMLKQEVREAMKANEGDTPRGSDDAT